VKKKQIRARKKANRYLLSALALVIYLFIISYLLGVKVSNMDQRKLLEKYKRKHDDYWRSRQLIQRRMEDFDPDCIFPHKKEQAEPGFRLFPKRDL